MLAFFFLLTKTRYNWNIVESGTKHHNPNPLYYLKEVTQIIMYHGCVCRENRAVVYSEITVIRWYQISWFTPHEIYIPNEK